MEAKRQEKAAEVGSDFLTTAEVAARYRTAPSTIRYWRMTGYLPAGTPCGRRILYRKSDLDAWDRKRDAAARGGDAA